MIHLTLEHGRTITTMLAVAAASIALAAYFYRRNFRSLQPRLWWRLFVLRALAIVLVVLLIFQPVASFEREQTERRALIFAVDTSASMGIADDASGKTRLEQSKSRVVEWWGRLQRDFDLSAVAFAERATPLEGLNGLADLQATGEATSLTRAVIAAGQNRTRSQVEAIVLFSDGIHNSAGDPVATAQKLGVVVHTIGVGSSLSDSSAYRDVQVTGLDCPPQLTVNNRAKLTAYVDAVGLAGHVVRIALEEDGKPVSESELVCDASEGSQEVSFQFVPTEKGRHMYTARIAPVADEKIEQNNHRSAIAFVTAARMRVLYVEGTLRAEYGALVDRFLSKDPDIEFCALVQTRPGVFLQRTNIEGLDLKGIPTDAAVLDSFHVLVLGDLDASLIKPEQAEGFARRVRDGAGLVMIGGYHSLGPGGYAGTRIEELLPVEVGSRDIGQLTDPFLPRLTPDGRLHPIFANIAGFFPAGSAEPELPGLPPLDGAVKVFGAKPGATVLALGPGPTEEPSAPMPVLAVQPVGSGRSAVFTGDTTRNWQQGPRAMEQESPFLRFWGQMLRWLAGRSDTVKHEAGIVANTDKPYYEPDSPVMISAVVRDKVGEGTSKADVVARIKGPRGFEDSVLLNSQVGQAGGYSGEFDPRQAGSYDVFVEAQLDDTTLSADKLVVEVGRPNLEFDRLDLDEKMLGRIASETGGGYLHVSNADRLLEKLDRKQQKRRIYAEYPLCWPPLFWVFFVGMLTSEWVLRKRYQLR